MISLRDADSMPAGVVRAYVSELYQEVYDQACAAQRPDLDVRVLLPPSGASGAGGAAAAAASGVGDGDGSAGGSIASDGAKPQASSSPFTFNPGPPPPTEGGCDDAPPVAGGRDFTVELVKGWATREVVELDPGLEVLFSDESRVGDRVETINAGRRLAGYPDLRFVSLESVASGAYKAEYFYAENALADIPTFSSVSVDSKAAKMIGFLVHGTPTAASTHVETTDLNVSLFLPVFVPDVFCVSVWVGVLFLFALPVRAPVPFPPENSCGEREPKAAISQKQS